MYKAIFIDIDDTLLDFNHACQSAFDKTMDQFNLEKNKAYYELFLKINNILWEQQKRGEISVQDVVDLRFKQLFTSLQIEQNYNYVSNTFQDNLAMEHVLVDGALEIIDYLSGKYSMFAASNSFFEMQKSRLERAHLLPRFSGLFISNEIGFEKPDFRFFETCLNRSGFAKQEILFVGDSLEADMKGAGNYGLDTCWYNPHQLKTDLMLDIQYTVNHLSDLKTFL